MTALAERAREYSAHRDLDAAERRKFGLPEAQTLAPAPVPPSPGDK